MADPRPSAPPALELVTMRRRSGKDFLGLHLLMLLLAGGIWAAGFFAIFTGVALPIVVGAGFVPLLFGWAYAAIARRTRTYRLYRDSLEIESGLVSRRIENLQVFRVRDVALRQGVLDRILNVGDVIVNSTDVSTPVLVVRGINDPRSFYASLRELVAAGAEKRTMIVEGDV